MKRHLLLTTLYNLDFFFLYRVYLHCGIYYDFDLFINFFIRRIFL
uniref:Uncharacterized protein n=1 Tax=Manihot esculenta TaxID=3983 RepID=A0A2C9V2S3_MANES